MYEYEHAFDTGHVGWILGWGWVVTLGLIIMSTILLMIKLKNNPVIKHGWSLLFYYI
jgi:hypothetical protein